MVGYLSDSNCIKVVHKHDRIVCCVTKSTSWFFLLAGVALGPYLTVLWYTGKFAQNPVWILIAIAFFSLVGWGMLFKVLLGHPRIEMPRSTGDLLFFARRISHPSKQIRREEIQGFELSERWFKGEGERIRNVMLSVVTSRGQKIPLCISPDDELITELRNDMAHVARLEA